MGTTQSRRVTPVALSYTQPVVCPVLVGRDAHLEVSGRLLARAASGRGQTVLVSGEAGVGKSRLLQEVRRTAAAQGALTLLGCAFEQDRTFPYAPLADAFRTWLAEGSPSPLKAWPPGLAGELVKLLPELQLEFPELAVPERLEPEAEKRRLFASLTQGLSALAAHQPLLFVLEDLHWSDDTSLEFLLYLARRLERLPLLLLLSYRPEEVRPELRHFLAECDRQRLASELPLSPLSRAEVDSMVQAIFDLPRPVRRDFLEALHGLTDGNPFFIEEVLQSLVSAGDIFYTDGGWDRKPLAQLRIPRSVQDTVARRLAGLGPEVRKLAETAAVAGRRFNVSLLQALTAHGERDLLDLIKVLVAAQLVVEEGTHRFAFRHALTREAIYKGLLAHERKALHRRVAEALERLDAAPDAHLADLAYHYYAAEAWEEAFHYAQRAGERALSQCAPQAAADALGEALDAARRQGVAPPPALYRKRAQANDTLGDFEAARADLETALTLAQKGGDRREAWQLLLDLGRLWAARDYVRSGDYFRRALTLARVLDDPAALAHSLNRVGNWHLNMDEPHEALSCHKEALAVFEHLGDVRAVAETCDLLGVAYALSDDQLKGVSHFERSVALFRELGDRRGLVSCLINLAELRGLYFIFGTMTPVVADPAAARREAEEALALTQGIGWRAGEAWALMNVGGAFAFHGEYGRALEYTRSGLELSKEIGNRQWAALCHFALGSLHLDLLAAEAAFQHAEQGVAFAKEMCSTLYLRYATYLLVQAHLLDGALGEAQALLDEVLPRDAPMQTTAGRLLWTARAELALARSDPDRALDIAERLIATAPNMAPGRVIPYLWKLRGEALVALGQLAEAETTLKAACAVVAEQGKKPLLWRLLVSLGKLCHLQKRFAEAEAHSLAAREVVTELAASIPDEALRANFSRQAGALVSPLSRRAEKRKEVGGLTAREREVVVLLAQGSSNRDIAAALGVSERTVDTHVGNVLNKLGFNSRVQIAAWAVAQGLMQNAD